MVMGKVGGLHVTVTQLTVGVSPPLTVTTGVAKLGAPVPAGKAVTVAVNTSWFLTSLTGFSGVMLRSEERRVGTESRFSLPSQLVKTSSVERVTATHARR